MTIRHRVLARPQAEGTASETDHWIRYGDVRLPGTTNPCSVTPVAVTEPTLMNIGLVKFTPAKGSATETVPTQSPRKHSWLYVTLAGWPEPSSRSTVPVTVVQGPVWSMEMSPFSTDPDTVAAELPPRATATVSAGSTPKKFVPFRSASGGLLDELNVTVRHAGVAPWRGVYRPG